MSHEIVTFPYGSSIWDARQVRERSVYSQRRPFRKPLPYSTIILKRTNFERHGYHLKMNQHIVPDLPEWWRNSKEGLDRNWVSLENNALTKVHDKLRIADSFFEDWYERKQAVALLTSSAKKLVKFAKNWKRPSYWTHLAKDRRPADLPSAWLAYNFGVKPLVGGVDRAIHLLGSDFPEWNVSGTSGMTISRQLYDANAYTFGQNSTSGPATHNLLCKIGCRVVGINPNTALSGAVGLGEPFSSAWAVLPWGWAVDYFVNVSELLSNIENKHPGIQVTDWYMTKTLRTSASNSLHRPSDYERERFGFTASADFFHMTREPLKSAPLYQMELKYPPLGGNQASYLMSALALTLKGKTK